jgi:hypothetical protein
MNRGTRDLLFIVAGLLLSAVTLWAGAGYDARLSKDVEYLNAVGSRPRGAKDLERSLALAFRTDAARVAELRKDRLGTGDVAAAFAVASRLAGGISDANLGRIVALWREEHAAGWAGIAKSLGVRLRSVVLKVESVGAQKPRTSVASTPSNVSQPGVHDTLKSLVHHG